MERWRDGEMEREAQTKGWGITEVIADFQSFVGPVKGEGKVIKVYDVYVLINI